MTPPTKPQPTAPARAVPVYFKPVKPDPLKCRRNRTGTSLHRCDECM